MKTLLVALFLATLLSSDEIQRIQNIVDDITKLRVEYETCKKQLNSDLKSSGAFEALSMKNDEKLQKYEMILNDEKQRNEILLAEIDVLTKEKQNVADLENKIIKLEKMVNNQVILLKSKENSIKNLKNEKSKTKVSKKNSLKNDSLASVEKKVVCEEKNSFPKLLMKDGYENSFEQIQETYTFKASAFRLKNDAKIYDNINGSEIYFWEKSTSFTSNEKNDKWVKVTGYFIDKKWLPSKEELWVKSENVIQR